MKPGKLLERLPDFIFEQSAENNRANLIDIRIRIVSVVKGLIIVVWTPNNCIIIVAFVQPKQVAKSDVLKVVIEVTL